ncbi:MAG: DUF3108 domain-containing protein [Maricaulaceae bacterium]
MKRFFYRIFIIVSLMIIPVSGTTQSPPESSPPIRDANGYDAAWHKIPANTPQNTHFEFDLKGYVFGIRMIKASYEGVISNGNYTVRSSLHTSGLGALLKKLKIWAITEGYYDQRGLHPTTHTQQNLDKKNRRVEMRYDYGVKKVDVAINPRIGSQGVPPATRKERFEADDTLSAILNLMMRQANSSDTSHVNAKLCEGEVNVFDSKQHYALRLVNEGPDRKKFLGKKTDIIKCSIYYVPISGFDPEDLPSRKEAETPISIYMVKSPELDMYVPSRFSYKISGFTAVIKVTDMRVNGQSAKE